MYVSSKPLTVVWAALLAGQLMFAGVAFALAPLAADPTRDRLLVGIAVAFGLTATAIVTAITITPRRNENAARAQAKTILRMAMLEGSSLFGIVAFLLSGKPAALIGSAVAFVALAIPRPASPARATP